ncbi:aromatic acid exporter family protein [Halalkalibacter akibai]|uniref:Integral membrane protein n=1 Tax=Halalkalibacter akibai (strain ATCC 43226 / DSM 21942 / CIP 109018 / JCM 9157 / 1139) TaxID=1236973 RepID=W4QPB1_HALA3|nr:aromatic acid exporter family protein [Halalkalibacter akibai]GAE33493.1 integral membrane protein [Halalkalibacter akibai JCM 9157]
MSFKIGYRTLKTAVGAGLAVAIAQALNLEFYGSAAIITVLCISVTRRDSLQVSWARLVACFIGIAISGTLFELIGYHPWTLALIILLFIPIVVMLKMNAGIATSSVIILHLYTVTEISFALIVNEILLIIIGIGVALLMNLYMPSSDLALRHYHQEIENHFKTILFELSVYLRKGESEWDGKEIPETVDLLQKGKNLAIQNIHNHILRYEDQYYYYFKMREKQFEILERLMPFVSKIHHTVEQSETVANFLEELSRSVSPANRVPYFLERLRLMRKGFEDMPLPTTREEFEVRSALVYIMHELEEYLHIKDRLWNEADKKKL